MNILNSAPILGFMFLSFAWKQSLAFPGNARRAFSKPRTALQATESIPITLLAGFLGTGKTTTLKHLLENKENKKIGVIVNDVASVNIDAKLVSGQMQDGVVELQNGCACCSLSDELFFSVEKLVVGRDLDAIVVELSGVADPKAIQSTWKMAPSEFRSKANVARVVTLIDAASFGYDYMTFDETLQREGWVDAANPCAGNRKVAELLVEQAEAANLLLVNKIDIASKEELEVTAKVLRALNEKAEIESVEFGVISPSRILGDLTAQAKEDTDSSDSHGHACSDPLCDDTSHEHNHERASSCTDPDCTDPSHEHSHSHATTCSDPDCDDPSHDHAHSHNHSTSLDNLDIVNFVYKASRPFQLDRLMALLNEWPVPIKETLDLNLLNEANEDGYMIGDKFVRGSPFVGVLRSKGFCWFAPKSWSAAAEGGDAWRHDTAMYWSHAGKAFGISSAGKWWGSMPKSKMKIFFDENMDEYERIMCEDFVSEEFGDRRQELVFIGSNLDKSKIREVLDNCLLTDEEMEQYRQRLRNYLDTPLTTLNGPGLFDVGAVDHLDSPQ